MSKSTQLPPLPVKMAFLPKANPRCKKFVVTYDSINGWNDETRPKQCRPMFALLPPPHHSAVEKVKYGFQIQSDVLQYPQVERPHYPRDHAGKSFGTANTALAAMKDPVSLEIRATTISRDRVPWPKRNAIICSTTA